MEKLKTVIVGILISCFMIGTLSLEDYIENTYTRKGVITSHSGLIWTIKDNYNQEWEYVGTGLKNGSKVKIWVDTNHTNKGSDDYIKKIKMEK